MDDAFIIHLIRHAPTAGNLKKQYIGWTDEPVLPFEAVADFRTKKVWGSDLQRCRQTAEKLFPYANYTADPDFRECHFGDWEMKTYEELKNEQRYRNWIDNPGKLSPPGGESFSKLAERVDKAFGRLPEGNEFTIIMHGGPLRYMLACARGQEFQEQIALHGDCHTLVWSSRKAFEERAICTSYSAAPLTANVNT
ncbi:histidine phosphatase family protein [Planococcus beigongshangi]|uniref:histidine phosphatase family protein n=1 Tax=Planococcus beigongshangi TaxID=2782536 RepID=UPI00193C7A60|nr:histidine phosphatase family protein [Planococcus beigongshangi]